MCVCVCVCGLGGGGLVWVNDVAGKGRELAGMCAPGGMVRKDSEDAVEVGLDTDRYDRYSETYNKGQNTRSWYPTAELRCLHPHPSCRHARIFQKLQALRRPGYPSFPLQSA